MKKMIIASAALALMCGPAFAQNTGRAPQSDNMQKPGMHNTEKGSMHKGTTGMNTGTNGMTRGGMQPDASGQGGSGPGSDQGGTKVAPGSMK
ncbi:hypothetical protein FJN17_00275 [Bradyrhizobium symbiodeficiens]|uniref:Pentapeptide MXKDX repeat protein n=1 Tax=Bradyrhizobium symbiodeficiens TaxID=1404367 RepID=A0ABX5VYR4_9BRAD|nr:hypothetical protein [Bradyrhizobium symbiodeficiens]QDF36128.1 hypothetical protein FJN17_00275 [Bradyrhizobium symbiodeficiens]